ncbi:MAG: hypothetical protein LQ350_007581 [Teloschistes chrysophthalmus]|nr:MAG: hypothetical protein LQ350_007581 [Niorma chrysophthalma]
MEACGKIVENGEEEFPWHLGVFDAHCHPTDTVASHGEIRSMKARALTIMATRGEDQEIVRQFANWDVDKGTVVEELRSLGNEESPCRIVPSFGWHPWFSHQILDDLNCSQSKTELPDATNHYKAVLSLSPDDEFILSLPEPRLLSGLLSQIREHLQRFPYALVGEIGIDRSFRLPVQWDPSSEAAKNASLTPGGRDGRPLTHHRVHIDHQRVILKAQLNLAGEMGRPVSVHGVAAHGVLFETLKETWKGYEKEVLSKREQKRSGTSAAHLDEKTDGQSSAHNPKIQIIEPKPYPPRICLHSYSGPRNVLEQYLDPAIPATVFFSFSCLVNFSDRTEKAVEVVKAVPKNRILIESDLHSAGERMDQLLEDAVRSVCEIKAWPLAEGVTQLAQNWRHFVFGDGDLI